MRYWRTVNAVVHRWETVGVHCTNEGSDVKIFLESLMLFMESVKKENFKPRTHAGILMYETWPVEIKQA